MQVWINEGKIDAKTERVAPCRSCEKEARCCNQSITEKGGKSDEVFFVEDECECIEGEVEREDV